MHHRPLIAFAAWFGASVSVATLAKFFQDWNPILQGGVYISTIVLMWWTAMHKKKVDRKDKDDTL